MSMVGPIMNKVKFCMLNSRKNTKLAEKLAPTVNFLAEQLLPNYLNEQMNSYEAVNMMHNLCYLLAGKAQQVFTSHVIHTIID